MTAPYSVNIVSIDPGGDTGWATATLYGKDRTDAWVSPVFWDSGQVEHDNHHHDLEALLLERSKVRTPLGETIVICEGWDNRASAAAELISIEYIGVVKLFAQKHPGIELIMQAAHEKEWCSNKKLKALDIYDTEPKWRHSNDAKRHIIKFLVNAKGHVGTIDKLYKALHPEG